MDRKVFIIRTWLLLIAMGGLTLAWPSVGIGVWPLLGMMISTYKCCCKCTTCDISAKPTQFQLDLDDFEDTTFCGVFNTCSSQYNKTFVLNEVVAVGDINAYCIATAAITAYRTPYAGTCCWVYAAGDGCVSAATKLLQIGDAGGTVGARLVLADDADPNVWVFRDDDIGLGAPPSAACESIASLSLPVTTTGGYCVPVSGDPTAVVTAL